MLKNMLINIPQKNRRDDDVTEKRGTWLVV